MITGKKVLNGLVDSLNEMSLSKMAGALQAVYKSDRYNSLDHLSFQKSGNLSNSGSRFLFLVFYEGQCTMVHMES